MDEVIIMERKLLIASISILGLISFPVFAEKLNSSVANSLQCNNPRGCSYQNIAPQQPIACVITRSDMIMDATTQNLGRSLPGPCSPAWFNRISLSGGINVDTGKFGNRNVSNPPAFGPVRQGYAGENTKRASLNDAYLNVGAIVNDWASAFMSLSYLDASNEYSMAYQTAPDSLNVDNANARLMMQQAYMHFGNFDYSPLYVEAGQQFQDYGRYELHPITEPFTQVLTESLRTALKFGLIMNGWSASFSTFQNPLSQSAYGALPFNYAGAIGYENPGDCFGYDLGIGYMYNMDGVNAVGNTAAYIGGVQFPTAIYIRRVDSVALYGDANIRSFALALRYTQAMTEFDPLDLPLDLNHLAQGAKPWAASMLASYGFNRWTKDQEVSFGYQISRETLFLNLPRGRYSLGYKIYTTHDTTFGAEWDHDIGYPVADGGTTQGNTNLVSLRFTAMFG